MKRQLNTRFLLWVVGALLVTAGLVHLLHAMQMSSHSGALLRQAQTALDKDDRARAVRYWQQFLAFQPDDVDVLIRYGLTLDELAANPRDRLEAWRILSKALARVPKRDDVRFRLIFCEIGLGLYRDAIKDLRAILPRWQTNPAELEHVLGWCYDAVEDYEQASEAFARAIRLDPRRIPSYVLRAEVLRQRLNKGDEADLVMEAMVQANLKNPHAYLALAGCHRQHDKLDKAIQAVDRALALDLAPADRAQALAVVADLTQAKGDASRARALAEEGLKLQPGNLGLHKVLAGIEIRAGNRQEAIARLRGGLARQPDDADLNVLLADLLLDEGAVTEVERLVGKLSRHGLPVGLRDYLQGRILAAQTRWDAATTLLERSREQLGPASAWSCRINAVLGLCYENLGDTEQQVAAFSRAVAQDPSWTAARLGLGSALLSAGRPQEALQQYRVASRAGDAPPDTAAALARALLLTTLGLPAAERNWSAVERAVDEAEQACREGATIALLRADLLAAKNDFGGARKLLTQARGQQPKNVPLWCASVDLAARDGRREDGLRLLEEARKAVGDGVELRLAQARFEALLRGLDARAILESLTADMNSLGAADQIRLLREMAELWFRLGDSRAAERCWRQAVSRQPNDVRGRVRLLELTLQNGRIEEGQRIVADLRRIEGNKGLVWRYAEAAVWVEQARHGRRGGDRQKLTDARHRLADLARQRPDWPRIPLLEARIAEIEANQELALQHYVRAVELGLVEPRIVAHTVHLLFQRRDFLRADQLLRRLEQHGTLGKDLTRLGAEIALRNRDLARALRLAEQTVPAATRDYRELLWLAGIQRAAGDAKQAEATLRRAVAHGGHTPEPWIALIEFLVRSNQRGQAHGALEEAKAKLAVERMALVEARAYELFGRWQEAEQVLQAALHVQPDDIGLLLETAEFYRRNDMPGKAEPVLRKLLDPVTAAPGQLTARARRFLAILLAAAGQNSEALALLDQNRGAAAASVSDERARALVLAYQPGQRVKAAAMFERTLSGPALSAEEHFWLVQLAHLVDQPARARTEMVALLAAHGDNAQFLAYYVRRLLQRQEMSDAQIYFERVRQLEPDSPRTQELRAALQRERPVN